MVFLETDAKERILCLHLHTLRMEKINKCKHRLRFGSSNTNNYKEKRKQGRTFNLRSVASKIEDEKWRRLPLKNSTKREKRFKSAPTV